MKPDDTTSPGANNLTADNGVNPDSSLHRNDVEALEAQGGAPIEYARLSAAMDGFRLSQCIAAVARLGLADAVTGTPITSSALAARVGANADALHRFLRAVASEGIFASTNNGAWTHTPMSRLLARAHPSAFAARAVALGSLAWGPWGELLHSIETGEPAFDRVHGQPFFAHLQAHPALADGFGKAMTSFTRATAQAVVDAVDLSAARHVVDVGGGHGVLLDALLQAHPSLRASLVDRPEVIARGAPQLRKSFAPRCALVAADFFKDRLPSADTYTLSWILHDWDDDLCIRLLRQCADAMVSGSKLLVVEMIIEPGDAPSPAKMFDLEMLVQTGGRERTEAEYAALLETSGLTLRRRIQTQAPHSVLEATLAAEV